MVFKVSVQVHPNYLNRIYGIYEANVCSSLFMHTLSKTETSNTGRDKYEVVGMEVGQ